MFSRSLTTSPSRSSTMSYSGSDLQGLQQQQTSSALLRASHPGSAHSSRSPSPPPVPSQDTQASFDVTLLMPHKYGGMSEYPNNVSNFDHFTEGPQSVSTTIPNRGFFGRSNTGVAGNDEDEDLDSIGMTNKSHNSSGKNSSMGHKTPDENSRPGNGGGLMDLLNLKLPKGRSPSRLSTVIQVRPYDELEGDSKEAFDGMGEIFDDHGLNYQRRQPPPSVTRSKSLNTLNAGTTQATPQSTSLSTTPQPGMYSQLSPTPSKISNFMQKKMSSSSFFPSPAEARRSRVTL